MKPWMAIGAAGIGQVLWLGGTAVAVGICIVTLVLALRPGADRHAAAGTDPVLRTESEDDVAAPTAISVNTIRPQKKALERVLSQPGTIKPWAQAELFSKASGYLKTIPRVPTPQLAADLLAQRLAASGPPIACAARLATAVQLALGQAPQIDIGSPVTAGELLLEIATPERFQEIVEKESLLQQRQAELEAARTALATFAAAVQAAKAQEEQAKAEVRKSASEHIFRTKGLARWKKLAEDRALTQENVEEREDQVNATLAAWESSKAKVETAHAELAVVSSKLAAARADIKVKEALVQIARDELHQAHILAEYSNIRAPFDGVITYRDVDEGDFVQNATTGQSRRLMTVTATHKVRVALKVRDKDAPWVRVGAEATVVLDPSLNWQVKGQVARTAQLLDPDTRNLEVEIDLENRDRRLLPGMYGNVTLTLQKIPDAQAIPATAVYSRQGENYIFLVQDGIAHRQRVRIHYDDGKEVEVVKFIGDREVPLDGSEELIVSNKGEIAEGQHVSTHPLGRRADALSQRPAEPGAAGPRTQGSEP